MARAGYAERARLLVVDDAAEARQLLSDYLGGQGFGVDSHALRQALAEAPPDLVLLEGACLARSMTCR